MDGTMEVTADEKAVAEFYRVPKQDRKASEEAGRPIFKSVEYVRICVPGDRNNLVDKPVREEDRQRFRAQYAAFVADKPQDEAVGTPLTAWGALTPERTAEYQFMKVSTVEQLANVSDSNIQRMGPGSAAERQKAKDYLESTKSRAPMLRLQAENTAMRSELEALRMALQQQGDRLESVASGQGLPVQAVRQVAPVEALPAPVAKKRGRPAKARQLT